LSLELLYPGYFGMFSLPNVDLLVACQKNYNDWVFDYASDANGRHPPAGSRRRADGIAAGYRQGLRGRLHPLHLAGGKTLFRGLLRPHLGPGARGGHARFHACGLQRHVPSRLRPPTPDPLAAYAGSAAAIQRTLVELLCRGVADRFPNLKIVVAEFNAGWLAHWLARLDQGVARENRFGRGPFMALRPLEIWHRQFHSTI
jgi:hypothetical protein